MKTLVAHIVYLLIFPAFQWIQYGSIHHGHVSMVAAGVLMSAIVFWTLRQKIPRANESWIAAFLYSGLGITAMSVIFALSVIGVLKFRN